MVDAQLFVQGQKCPEYGAAKEHLLLQCGSILFKKLCQVVVCFLHHIIQKPLLPNSTLATLEEGNQEITQLGVKGFSERLYLPTEPPPALDFFIALNVMRKAAELDDDIIAAFRMDSPKYA